MTAKMLMFEDTIGEVLYRSEKATNPFRDGVRTNVLKMMKYNEIKCQIVHSALGFDYYEILQTAKT